jgi:hypothetical protein
MAKTLQFRRGTTAELASVTGAEGELFVDITKDTVVVMDGNTAGGKTLATEEFVLANSGSVGGDIVADSALIGDVSIVGNEISGVDSYGNNSELLINAPLTVNAGGTSSNTVLFTNTLTSAGWLYHNNGSFAVEIVYARQNVKELFMALNPGDTFTLRDNNTNLPVTYTFTSLFESGSDLIINVEEYNNGSNINFSQNYLELNYSVNTLVNVLEVTESGVNVEGTFTVNGQPVGGAGASFDQDLNTTNDVVFNSALVGDVSIVGNEISAVDSYGNIDTLVLNPPVEFKNTTNTTVTNALQLGSSNVQFTMNSIYISNLNTQPVSVQEDALSLGSIAAGTQIEVEFYDYGLYSNRRFRFALSNVYLSYDPYNPSVLQAVALYPQGSAEYSTNGGASWQVLSGAEYFSGNSPSVFYSITSTVIQTIASVTESGVAIEGTLTVNGQSVANYDQDLNTTDNVVFNSALVGDVSIIGNEISAVDSYGNSSNLTISSDVTIGSSGAATYTLGTTENNIYIWQWVENSLAFVESDNTSGVPQTPLGIYLFNNVNPGTVLTLSDGVTTAEVTVIEIQYVGPEFGVGFMQAYVVDNTIGGAGFSGSEASITSVSVGTATIAKNLSVIGNLEVTGALTVNGQPVGGAGASYDQSLNTTDNVVFNSALVGDVSIIGNEISAVDSYGNADTLVVSGGLEVTKEDIITNSYDSSNGLAWGGLNLEAGAIRIQNYTAMNLFTQNLLSSIPAGARVTIRKSGVLSTYTVVSVTTEAGMGGDTYVIAVEEPFVTQYGGFDIFIAIETTSSITAFSVTESGVNVNGAFTINGQEITGGGGGSDYQPIGITQLTLDDTNVTTMISVSEVKSVLFINNDPSYTGSDPAGILLPVALEGQRITIFNGSATNTCTILNAYPLAGSPPSSAAMAPQSALTVIHLSGGNWSVC